MRLDITSIARSVKLRLCLAAALACFMFPGYAFAQAIAINPSSLPPGTQGLSYNQTVVANDTDGDDIAGSNDPDDVFTYSVSSGTLPPGVTLNANSGNIFGTPTTPGVYTFTIQAADQQSTPNTGQRTYTVNIGSNSLSISPASLPNATQGAAYNQTVTASGGTGPYTYSITAGALPAGLTLNPNTGSISGNPTASGPSNFTIQALDSNGNIGTRAYSVNVGTNSLTLSPPTLPPGTQGSPYNQTVTASGGTGPYTYSVAAGSLPAGLSLNPSTGAITGTPTGSGASGFTIQAIDTLGNTGSRAYSVNIGTSSLTLSPPSLPPATQSSPYSQTVSASGGSGPYTYAVAAGALPAGLTLNPNTGAITGTPTGAGPSSFTIQATDGNGDTGSRAYSINVGTNALTVNPASLPNGTVGVAYNPVVSATGGTGPYTFAISAGALPAGLSLNTSTGAITGTPTASGPANFDIRALDANGNTGTRSYAVSIGTNSLTLNPTSLPAGTQGVPYNQTVTATGGTGPYAYAITSGVLPAGLSLNPNTGAITGTPTGSGASSFTIQATDSKGNTGNRAYSVNVGTSSLSVNPAGLPNGTQGIAYAQTVSASGGTAPYTFAISSGALPAGLSLNTSTGAITGTPTGSGPSNFTIRATDVNGNTGSRSYTVNIGTNSLALNPSSLPAATQGVPYSQAVTATGGTGPYSYAVTAGVLPAGLSLNPSTGAITGTPTGSGPSSFTIQATDPNGNTGSRAYSVNVGTNSLTVNPASLPPAAQGVPYVQSVTASGGTAPYTFNIQSGALPPGLSLNPNSGAITGTPTSAGSFAFTIQASDANGNTGTRSYTIATRPDPTQDPNVRALVAAQAATSRRFADAQVTNVSRHLESVHDHFDSCGIGFGVGISVFEPPPGDILIERTGEPTVLIPAEPRSPRPARDCAERRRFGGVAYWIGGTMQFGSPRNNGLTTDNRFSTGGITTGVDIRVWENLIVGAAAGYGSNRTTIAPDGTRSDATSYNAMVYASYKPFGNWFVDASLGGGSLDFNNQRWITADSALAAGTRSGRSWFGSVAVGPELRYGGLKWAPYVRADFMLAHLDGYGEQSLSNQALTFGGIDFNSVSTVLGVRSSYDIITGWGIIAPTMRLDYRHAWDSRLNQFMWYNDLGAGTSYLLTQDAAARNVLSAAIGLRASVGTGATVEVEYGTSAAGATSALVQTLRGALRLAF